MPIYDTEAEFLKALKHIASEDHPRHEVIGTDADPVVVTCRLDLRGLALKHPVRVENVTFQKFADFSEWRCGASLRLERCEFRSGLRLTDTRVEGLCSLSRSKLHAPGSRQLDFRRLRVGGVFDCTRITASVGLNLIGLHTEHDVWFNFARIRVWGSVESLAVDMEAADVGGSVFFCDGARVTGRIDLRAKVGGSVGFLGATVTARDNLLAVVMSRAVVGGAVFFLDGTRVTGRIDLRAKVGSQVNFNNSTVTAQDDLLAVDLEQADVGGSVFFHNGTRVTGGINLRARVGGAMVFDGTSILAAAGTNAVRLDEAVVRGQLFLLNGVWVRGHLQFRGVKIGGGLAATPSRTDVTFTPPNTLATTRDILIDGDWDMSFAEVNGPVQLHGVSLCGRFFARHLTVHGDLDLCGSVVGPPTDDARGRLDTLFGRLRDDPKSWSDVWEPFEFERTAVPVPDGATPDQLVAHRAVDLELADINGRLWVKQSRVLGTAYLEDTTVVGEANFDGTDVRGDLVLRSAEIKGQVFADERDGSTAYPRVSGRVDLAFATIQQVDVKFDRAVAAVTPEYLDLTGATVDSLRLSGTVAAEEPPFVVAEGLRFGTLDCDGLTVARTANRVSRSDRRRYRWWIALVGIALALAVWHRSWILVVIAVYTAATVWECVRGWMDRRYDVARWWCRGLAVVLSWCGRRRHRFGARPALAPTARWLWCAFRFRRVYERWCRCHRLRSGLLDHLDQTYPFSRGYYVLVERKLREAGNDPDADEVFLMRRRRETQRPKEPDKLPRRMRETGRVERWAAPNRPTKWLLRALDFLMGFGVRPWRLVHLYVVLGLLNAAVFLNPRSVERPVAFVQERTDTPLGWWPDPNPSGGEGEPRPKNPWPSDGGVPDVDGDDAWGTGHALFMALRVQVPVLALVAENDWSPATRPVLQVRGFRLFSYADYASIMMVANLVLIPLIVAGLTCYLKK